MDAFWAGAGMRNFGYPGTELDRVAGDSLAYTLRYTPTSRYVGTEAMSIRLINPIGSPARLTLPNIPLTMCGFTSGLTASGRGGYVATGYTCHLAQKQLGARQHAA